jgi:pyruvate dehydrogenase E2 component (dihydrolipoamide acetyltransferase)
MAFEFHLPDIGEGVVEGEIVAWKVKVGDRVTLDQPIVEVMTDKATVEIPSPRAGLIKKINYTDGQICPVGQVLLVIEEEGGSASSGNGHSSAPEHAPPPQSQIEIVDASAGRQRVLATPSTRRLARQLGVELGRVQPSGKRGRVTSDDVRGFVSRGPALGGAPAAGRAFAPVAIPPGGAEERVPFRGIRKRIADNMTRSTQTSPTWKKST